MHMTSRSLHLACLGALIAAGVAHAADRGKGHFHMGESGIEVRHAAAVRIEQDVDPANDRIHVYLGDAPFDPVKLAAAFDPEDAAREQFSDRSGGYVRLCVTAEGDECGLFYLRRQPDDSFNTSGYGVMKIDVHSPSRIAGRWELESPETFFEETYQFDLRFDVAITPLPGSALPEGGGEPGTAYRAWAAAVRGGDVTVLRRMLGEDARWRLPEDDADRVKETLKSLRDEQPLQPTILRGRRDGDDAVLWVEGVDRDDIHQRGRVLMRRVDGIWHFIEADLESVEE